MKDIIVWLFLFLYLVNVSKSQSHDLFPQETWMEISNPGKIGWSEEKLSEAESIADSIGSDAVLIIYRGAVLKAWGDVERKFMCHSMRKSLLSVLYGIKVDDGTIDLQKSLAELKIDDSPNLLTPQEKTATVENLLSSRSGIYLPAAYEFPSRKPSRGEFKPGENWHYPNNWDYNALLTIYEQETGHKFFQDFSVQLAEPLGMQDFEISDGYYHFEFHKSSHPAYPFRMSARDLARIGLLFMRNGKWNDDQLISRNWVEKSTSPISKTYGDGQGYGYLWWTDAVNFKYPYYSAEGSGGHGIIVVPELETVIIHRVDTYIGDNISYRQRGKLISKIMEAFVGEETDEDMVLQKFKPYKKVVPFDFIELDNPKSYPGLYKIEKLLDFESEEVEIYLDDKSQLGINIPYKGHFSLMPISSQLFMLEDSKEFIYFLLGPDKTPNKIIYHRNSRVGEKN